jgi:hypothetical protein
LRSIFSDPESADIIALVLPDTSPAVTAVRILADMLRPVMHTIDVSEPHIVASQPDPPRLPTAVHDTRPKLPPAMVSVTDSLDKTLDFETLVQAPASYDTVPDVLPTIDPPVKPTRSVRVMPPAL